MFRRNLPMPARDMRRLKTIQDVILESVGSPTFYCDICKMSFPSANALIAHGQKVHGR